MIDIVIPYVGSNILTGYYELVFCLRSIEKNLTGVRDIYIIGNVPPAFKGLIEVKKNYTIGGYKNNRILEKVLVACNHPDISEDFLFMNDDHFLIQSCEASEFPFYYREEDMIETINRGKNGYKANENSRNYLLQHGKKTKMFDSHCPIIYNKKKFLAMENINPKIEYGYAIKSLYANMQDIEGTFQKDYKIFDNIPNQETLNHCIQGAHCISNSVTMPTQLKIFLEKTFPNKSKYEQ